MVHNSDRCAFWMKSMNLIDAAAILPYFFTIAADRFVKTDYRDNRPQVTGFSKEILKQKFHIINEFLFYACHKNLKPQHQFVSFLFFAICNCVSRRISLFCNDVTVDHVLRLQQC